MGERRESISTEAIFKCTDIIKILPGALREQITDAIRYVDPKQGFIVQPDVRIMTTPQ